FPGFRMGTSPAPSSRATAEPNRKPRDSIATTRVIRASRYGCAISFTACANSVTSSSTSVTSLNTIPGFGKTFTSPIARFKSSYIKWPRDLQFARYLKPCDVGHARIPRTTSQLHLQCLKCFLRSFRNYFNRAVRQVLRKAAELESPGFTHDKPPEPDPLNATPDNPAPAAQIADSRRWRRRRHT